MWFCNRRQKEKRRTPLLNEEWTAPTYLTHFACSQGDYCGYSGFYGEGNGGEGCGDGGVENESKRVSVGGGSDVEGRVDKCGDDNDAEANEKIGYLNMNGVMRANKGVHQSFRDVKEMFTELKQANITQLNTQQASEYFKKEDLTNSPTFYNIYQNNLALDNHSFKSGFSFYDEDLAYRQQYNYHQDNYYINTLQNNNINTNNNSNNKSYNHLNGNKYACYSGTNCYEELDINLSDLY